jgi:hypothetical protein
MADLDHRRHGPECRPTAASFSIKASTATLWSRITRQPAARFLRTNRMVAWLTAIGLWILPVCNRDQARTRPWSYLSIKC